MSRQPLQTLTYFELAGCVLIILCCQNSMPLLAYERHALIIQPWRLWTGHWVHASWTHAILNMCALLLLPAAVGAVSRVFFWTTMLITPMLLSVLFFYLCPDLQGYVGLSGVLHALYTGAVYLQLRSHPTDRITWLLGVGLILKITTEQFGIHSISASLIGAPIMVDAHLFGVIIGLGVAMLVFLFTMHLDTKRSAVTN